MISSAIQNRRQRRTERRSVQVNCRICANDAGNLAFEIREMMLGLRNSFTYIECGDCGCLFLENSPPDLSPYYPPDYICWRGSRNWGIKQFIRKMYHRAYLSENRWLRKHIPGSRNRLDLQALVRLPLEKNFRILDVGCGAGTLVQDLKAAGFTHAVGIDPYIHSGTSVVRRQNLQDMDGEWDIVMLHHSFEHMLEPKKVLPKLLHCFQTEACVSFVFP